MVQDHMVLDVIYVKTVKNKKFQREKMKNVEGGADSFRVNLEYSSRLFMIQGHKVLMVQDHMVLDVIYVKTVKKL